MEDRDDLLNFVENLGSDIEASAHEEDIKVLGLTDTIGKAFTIQCYDSSGMVC